MTGVAYQNLNETTKDLMRVESRLITVCEYIRWAQDTGMAPWRILGQPFPPQFTASEQLQTALAAAAHTPGLHHLIRGEVDDAWVAASEGTCELVARSHDNREGVWGRWDLEEVAFWVQRENKHLEKANALAQTPDYVRGLILDQTLTKAFEAFPGEVPSMIDPCAGTGLFLVDGYHRLRARFPDHEPESFLPKLCGVELDDCLVGVARFQLCATVWLNTGVIPEVTPSVAWADSLLEPGHELQPYMARPRLDREQFTWEHQRVIPWLFPGRGPAVFAGSTAWSARPRRGDPLPTEPLW